MAYGWRRESLSSEGEPERMRFAGRADSIGRTYQDDSERSSRRKANEAETGWSQPAHKLQTRPPRWVKPENLSARATRAVPEEAAREIEPVEGNSDESGRVPLRLFLA